MITQKERTEVVLPVGALGAPISGWRGAKLSAFPVSTWGTPSTQRFHGCWGNGGTKSGGQVSGSASPSSFSCSQLIATTQTRGLTLVTFLRLNHFLVKSQREWLGFWNSEVWWRGLGQDLGSRVVLTFLSRSVSGELARLLCCYKDATFLVRDGEAVRYDGGLRREIFLPSIRWGFSLLSCSYYFPSFWKDS